MSDTAKILVGKDASEVSKHLCGAVERLFAARFVYCLLFVYFILCCLNCLFFRADKEAPFVIGLSGGSLPKFFAMGAATMKVNRVTSRAREEVCYRFPGMFIYIPRHETS